MLEVRSKGVLSDCMMIKRLTWLQVFMALYLVILGQGATIENNDGVLGLKFRPYAGNSYKICASSDLLSWCHVETVRGDRQVTWPVPANELLYKKRFYCVERVVAVGLDNLTNWTAYQSEPVERYCIGLLGDSYTHDRERYAKKLKQNLTAVYGNLGAGYLGFAYVIGSGANGSIDQTELHYSITNSQWMVQYGSGYGPEACHVTSAVTNAHIDVQVLKTVDTMKIYYADKLGTTGFKYRIQTGGWTAVATDGPLAFKVKSIDLAEHSAPYTVEIETTGVGVSLTGVETVISGDGVVVHKLGATGKRAIHFMDNSLNRAALKELDLDMAIVMFGTNEQLINQTPLSFKSALENIVDKLRQDRPGMDIALTLPCYTKYELESPRTYKLHDYGQVMRQVAVEKGAAYFDFTEVFGPAEKLQKLIDTGLMGADRIHPTSGLNSGGHLMADTITRSVLLVP